MKILDWFVKWERMIWLVMGLAFILQLLLLNLGYAPITIFGLQNSETLKVNSLIGIWGSMILARISLIKG